jgi:hypothetical protein
MARRAGCGLILANTRAVFKPHEERAAIKSPHLVGDRKIGGILNRIIAARKKN